MTMYGGPHPQELQLLFKETMNGDKCPDKLAESALALIKGTVPKLWVDQLGPTSPPQKIAANEWMLDLNQRYVFLDKLLNNGRKKTPVVNLGFFLRPQTYCSIIKQVRTCMFCHIKFELNSMMRRLAGVECCCCLLFLLPSSVLLLS